MRRTWLVLAGAALSILLVASVAPAQYSYGQNPYSGYEGSSLMQNPSASAYGDTPVYYPYWYNYLDGLQQQGGYYSVTGQYGNSVPVTSYYPATEGSGGATQPQPTGQQSNMYYNPNEYYASQGQTGQYNYQYPSQPQAPAAQVQQAQQPATTKKRSSKKRRIRAQAAATAQAPDQAYQPPAYQQQPQPYQQQAYQQQPQPYQQQPYQQEQQPYPQPYQDPQQQYYQQQLQAYQQQQYYNQQAYQQQGYQQQQPYQQPQPGTYPVQQQAQGQQGGYSEDPLVQRAQEKAYARALARQRAAELASQQQAALQELQQARQIFESAQLRVQEQEDRQKAFQQEYHRKAVSDAYDSLRMAQQRYYDLMGVSTESGAGQQRGYPTSAPPTAQQYSQPVGPGQGMAAGQYAQGGIPVQRYGGAQPTYGPPSGPTTPAPAQQPSQVTPLRVQEPQQQSGGFWNTLKEILLPPTSGPSPRSIIDGKRDMSSSF